jgi:uncharacterized protein YndB with AHSA1/START domain
MAAHDYEPVVRSITVDAPVEKAFRVFTEDISTWWPFERHSIGEDKVVGAVIEARAGGRVYEVWADGTTCSWAEVTRFESPTAFALAWKVNPEAPAATEITVTFTPQGESTEVTLEHKGWERLGDGADDARESYSSGWSAVLDRYAGSFTA